MILRLSFHYLTVNDVEVCASALAGEYHEICSRAPGRRDKQAVVLQFHRTTDPLTWRVIDISKLGVANAEFQKPRSALVVLAAGRIAADCEA